MAIKYYDKYPQRWESPSQDYPQGAFKNLSALGEQDGSYLEKDWLNDQAGFFGALLRNAEMTPNGLIDTAQKSQFYDALLVCARKAVDLGNYYTKAQVDDEILANKTEVAQELGDSPEKVVSQSTITKNLKGLKDTFVYIDDFNPTKSKATARTVYSRMADLRSAYPLTTSVDNTANLDDTLDYFALQEADLTAARANKKLLISGGDFYISRTVYKTSNWEGIGNNNAWDIKPNKGTVIQPFGDGNPKKWHDISDDDEGIATVMITSCRSGLSISSITLYEPRTDLSAWDVGLHFPAVRRQNVDKVDVIGGWKSGAQYIDATWYVSNDTLNSLHPLVKADTGCNEYNISNSFVRGVRGLVIQGTTRDKSTPNFRWSNGGTSDINLYGMRFGTSGDVDLRKSIGCAFSHDVVIPNTAGSGQGINFVNCTFRVASKYSYRLDHSNRINFINLYAETISSWREANGSALNSITENTTNVSAISCTDGHSVEFKGELLSATSAYSKLPIIRIFNNGKTYLPNYSMAGISNEECALVSYEDTARVSFSKGDRRTGAIEPILYMTSANVRPAPDVNLNLGSSNYPFDKVYMKNQPNVVSDKRKKKDIVKISDVYMRIIEKMDFKQFCVLHDDRTHFGILAQDWVEACESEGVDPFEASVLHGSEDEGYAVSYGELQNLFNAYILSKLK